MRAYSPSFNPIDVYTSGVRAAIVKILPLIVATLTIGCTKSVSYVGHWVGNHNLKGSNESPILFTLGKVDLTITDGGKFDLVESGINKTGTVSYGNGYAMLNIERIMDRPIEAQGKDADRVNPPITVKVVEEGKALSFDDPGAFEDVRKTLRLTRSSSQP